MGLQIGAGQGLVDEEGGAVVGHFPVGVSRCEVVGRAIGAVQACARDAGGHGGPVDAADQLHGIAGIAVDHKHAALVDGGGWVVGNVRHVQHRIQVELDDVVADTGDVNRLEIFQVVGDVHVGQINRHTLTPHLQIIDTGATIEVGVACSQRQFGHVGGEYSQMVIACAQVDRFDTVGRLSNGPNHVVRRTCGQWRCRAANRRAAYPPPVEDVVRQARVIRLRGRSAGARCTTCCGGEAAIGHGHGQQLLVNLVQRKFAHLHQQQLLGVGFEDLTAKFAANAATRTGHQHGFVVGVEVEQQAVGLDGFTAQQVVNVQLTHIAQAHLAGGNVATELARDAHQLLDLPDRALLGRAIYLLLAYSPYGWREQSFLLVDPGSYWLPTSLAFKVIKYIHV